MVNRESKAAQLLPSAHLPPCLEKNVCACVCVCVCVHKGVISLLTPKLFLAYFFPSQRTEVWSWTWHI